MAIKRAELVKYLNKLIEIAPKDTLMNKLIDDILATEDSTLTTVLSSNIFHYASKYGTEEMIDFFIKSLPRETILASDNEGYHAFHYAKFGKNVNIIEKLRNNKIFAELEQQPSLYGSTYDEAEKINISQNVINLKLKKYMDSQGLTGKDQICREGNCSGWSFLYLIYASSDQEEEFFQILELIGDLDLDNINNIKLPDNLKEKYKDIHDLLTQVINDVSVFQSSSNTFKETQLPSAQQPRKDMYNLVKDPKLDRELKQLFSAEFQLKNAQELAEVLSHLSHWPGLCVDITFPGHATALIVTPTGEFEYYDSNFKHRVKKFKTAEELANHMLVYFYKKFNEFNTDGSFYFNFKGLKFYNTLAQANEVEVPAIPFQATSDSTSGFRPIHYAVLNNDIKMLEENLKDCNAKDAMGMTPLMWAGILGNKDFAKKLLNANADVALEDRHGNTPLGFAIKNRDSDMVDFLIKNGAKTDQLIPIRTNPNMIYPLSLACWNGDEKTLKVLIENGADVNAILGVSSMTYALLSANDNVFSLLLANGADANGLYSNNKPLLLHCAGEGNLTLVRKLLEHGANINIVGPDGTALALAVKAKNLELIKLLLDAGANPEVADKNGQTPRQLAMENEELGKFFNDVLTAKEKDKNKNESIPAKRPALITGHFDHKRLINDLKRNLKDAPLNLKINSADLANNPDTRGDTTLHLIAKSGNMIFWKQFMMNKLSRENNKSEFDFHKKNKDGNTPIELAAIAGHAELVREMGKEMKLSQGKIEAMLNDIKVKRPNNKI